MNDLPFGVALGVAAGLALVLALLSAAETAVLSVRRGDREQMARSGRRADKRVLGLLGAPRVLASTTLLAGETAAAALTLLVAGLAAEIAEERSPGALLGIGLAVALPIVVLLAKILPKSLALRAPLGWARATADGLAVLIALVSPLRLLLEGLATALARLVGAGTPATRDVSEEEFRKLIDVSSAEGQVDARERRLIHRVFEFSDKNVGQVMTPREKVFALAYDVPMSRLAKEVAARGFSRVPIFQKSLDNVRGILNAKDLLRAPGQVRPLAELLKEPLFVPRTTPVKRLFLTFKQKKVHMAVVVNEYGKVLGVVTMDDLLEQIFGAIRDERELVQGGGKRGQRGRTPVPGAGVETGPVALLSPASLLDDEPARAGDGDPTLPLAADGGTDGAGGGRPGAN